MNKRQKSLPRMVVRLGPSWTRFAQPDERLSYLGTVAEEASIGALARTENGDYVQVNGDWSRLLDPSEVRSALQRANALVARGRSTRPIHMDRVETATAVVAPSQPRSLRLGSRLAATTAALSEACRRRIKRSMG
jgi:hypothetical protein